jgi:alkaline phosphatase D
MTQRFDRWIVAAATVVVVGLAVTASANMFPHSVASGDPRPDSVILWTHLDNPEMPDALSVEVALDEDFEDVVFTQDLVAEEQYGYAVKVRADGLLPFTTYYYRFAYGTGGAMEYSPVGRTKTAPSPDMDVPVKFAVVYCQDYIGRYYNTYLKLLMDHDEDIDFVVHLGDYIYETTGDPSFQDPDSERTIEFDDMEGAIELGDPEDPYYAAASLSNYRQLYETYRSDPVLQQVHERWPMIVIWDDHEFSNDRWQENATYSNGRVDESQPDRLRNGEQAFFEWIPIAVGIGDDGTLEIDSSILYPNTQIYRDFLFGQNLHLVLTDYRTFRPDHLIPEEAFPGTIAVDEAGLIALLTEPVYEAVKGNFDPYVNMDVLGSVFPIMQQTAALIAAQGRMASNPALDVFEAVRVGEADVSGNVSATFINLMYEQAGLAPPFSDDVLAALPRGISFLYMGKSSFYSSAGSRNQVIWDTFNLYAGHLYITEGPASQDALGGQQTAWFQGTMIQSPAMWKVVGSPVMMTPLLVDFTHPIIADMLPPEFPDALRTRLGITMDQYDGFPQKKLEMLGLMYVVPNSVAISGDIHSTFVTDHTNGVYEFTAAAVSSATIGAEVARRILEDPILGQIPGIEDLVENLDLLLQISTTNDDVVASDILYADTNTHGFSVIEAGDEALMVEIYEIPAEEAQNSYYDNPDALDDLFWSTSYTVQDGQLTPGE